MTYTLLTDKLIHKMGRSHMNGFCKVLVFLTVGPFAAAIDAVVCIIALLLIIATFGMFIGALKYIFK